VGRDSSQRQYHGKLRKEADGIFPVSLFQGLIIAYRRLAELNDKSLT